MFSLPRLASHFVLYCLIAAIVPLPAQNHLGHSLRSRFLCAAAFE